MPSGRKPIRPQTGTSLNYQAIGSGGGIKQIKAKTVDFGASDKPLKPDELNADGLMQFPTVIGGVVPVMNLPGVKPGQLKLTGGDPGRHLPRRDQEAGTTRSLGHEQPGRAAAEPADHRRAPFGRLGHQLPLHLLSDHARPPPGPARSAPATRSNGPTGIGGKGNDGVAAFVKQTIGSIGYVEYAYAKQNALTYP